MNTDTIAAADSAVWMPEPSYGIILEKPRSEEWYPAGKSDNGLSWIIGILFLLFVVLSLRYRKNKRFFSLMLKDVLEVRERHNAFDDTLRETTFLWLMNLLWCASAGTLLFVIVCRGQSISFNDSAEAIRIFLCMGIAAAYTLFLTSSYAIVGNLFSDSGKASLWVKGYLSSQGLESILLFPFAVLALCLPELSFSMVVLGGIVFIIAKFLFIYKGFCIFFTQSTSWILFLYYLCSLEIVPIVLTYLSATYVCGLV